MIRLYYLAVALILIALSACATQRSASIVTDASHELWQQRQQQLSTIDHWNLRGRVALYIQGDVHNLGLSWNRNQSHSTLKLEAPLSQGMVSLESTPSLATLTTSEGDIYTGKNAQQVLLQATGWSIPVEGLTSWITGINHSTTDYSPDIDASGRALSITQDNWRINYLNYAPTKLEAFKNSELPQKIYMKHDNLALKIVIDQWQNPTAPAPSDIFPVFQ